MKYQIISNVMLNGVLRKKGEAIELDSESPEALDLVGRNLIEPFQIPEVKTQVVGESKEESSESKKSEKEVEPLKTIFKKKGRKKGKK